jgi:ZIP family zinc transporter
MALAGGAIIFVSVHELLPMAKRYHKMHLFILDAVLSMFVYAPLAALIPE